MAKYDITYKCGHEGTVNLFGKSSDRERKIEWLQNSCVCPACQKAAEEAGREETEKAHSFAEITVGSEKQIKYAADLREKFWAKVEEGLKTAADELDKKADKLPADKVAEARKMVAVTRRNILVDLQECSNAKILIDVILDINKNIRFMTAVATKMLETGSILPGVTRSKEISTEPEVQQEAQPEEEAAPEIEYKVISSEEAYKTIPEFFTAAVGREFDGYVPSGNASTKWLLAYKGDEIIGITDVSITKKTAKIRFVYVVAEYRGRGLSIEMVKKAMELAENRKVSITVRHTCRAAMEQLGFTAAQRNWINWVAMTKEAE